MLKTLHDSITLCVILVKVISQHLFDISLGLKNELITVRLSEVKGHCDLIAHISFFLPKFNNSYYNYDIYSHKCLIG